VTNRITQTLVALALSALWAIALGYRHWNGGVRALDRAEGALTDLRLLARGARAAPDIITIVAIDDDTAAKKGSYPLPRAELAHIIESIARFEPRVIALDLLLLDHGNDSSDAALASALGRRPSVIATAGVFADATQQLEATEPGSLARLPQAERFLSPLKVFSDHAAVGAVNLATDASGTPRGVPMLVRSSDRVELSFPLQVAALASGNEPDIQRDSVILGNRRIATDIDHILPLAFYGGRGTIRTVSAAAVLNDEVARDVIRDRIVVVGTTVTGGGDVFATPFDPVTPGTEIIATAIGHLITGDGMLRNRSTRLADAVIALGLTMLLVSLLAWRRSALGLLSIAVVVVIWAATNFLAFSHGLWLSAALPIAAAAPPAVLFGALQLWLNRRQAQYFAMKNELLQQFQAPVLRRWLTRNPDFLLQPVRQDAAIVFIDLAGSTSLSETLGMDAMLGLLKDFHALTDKEAVSHGGVITSFLGDGAMILFGLPESTADDARNAALCCLDLCKRMEQWIASLPPPIALRTGYKVGAHYGPIIASRLGDSYQHITATGDTVNVASRLVEVAAKESAPLAVSEDLLRQAGPDCALFGSGILTAAKETRLRGRSRALTVRLWRNDSSGLDESTLMR
jgi:adenylate cyclase